MKLGTLLTPGFASGAWIGAAGSGDAASATTLGGRGAGGVGFTALARAGFDGVGDGIAGLACGVGAGSNSTLAGAGIAGGGNDDAAARGFAESRGAPVRFIESRMACASADSAVLGPDGSPGSAPRVVPGGAGSDGAIKSADALTCVASGSAVAVVVSGSERSGELSSPALGPIASAVSPESEAEGSESESAAGRRAGAGVGSEGAGAGRRGGGIATVSRSSYAGASGGCGWVWI